MKPLPVRSVDQEDRLKAVPQPTRHVGQMDRVRRPLRSRTGLLLVVLIVLGVSIAFGLMFVRDHFQNSMAVDGTKLTFGLAEIGPFQEFVPMTGVLVPERSVLLSTAQGGRVDAITVEDGQRVEAGDVLIMLSNIDLELQVMAREAQLTEQLSNLSRAQTSLNQVMNTYQRDLVFSTQQIAITQDRLNRMAPLAGDGVTRESVRHLELELEGLQSVHQLIIDGADRDREMGSRNLERLQQSVDRLADGLDLMRTTLADLSIKSPISGQVAIADLEIGQIVLPGAPLGQVDAAGDYKVRARLDEFYLGQIFPGQQATVLLGSVEHRLEVTKVYPTVAERLFEVDLVFTGGMPAGLRRGQSLQLRVHASATEEVLSVPNGRFFDFTKGEWAFVRSADGEAVSRRAVTFGRRNSERVEIIEGLQPGEQIVTSTYEDFQLAQTLQLTEK